MLVTDPMWLKVCVRCITSNRRKHTKLISCWKQQWHLTFSQPKPLRFQFRVTSKACLSNIWITICSIHWQEVSFHQLQCLSVRVKNRVLGGIIRCVVIFPFLTSFFSACICHSLLFPPSLSSTLKGYSQTWTPFGLCSGNRDGALGSLPFKERSPSVDN